MKDLNSKIYNVRNKQVMLDSDLAKLYQIPTKQLNLAVKRNIERFPKDFMFKLTESEFEILRLQIETSTIKVLKHKNKAVSENKGGRTYLPYVFTEQGVAMLSGILRSKIAIQVNIQIMRAFIQMRTFLQNNANIFQKLESHDKKLLTHDVQINKIFNLIQEKEIKPEKGIFFDGQVFDAHIFINNLISSAKNNIILIDNFIDENTLKLFSQSKIKITIYTKHLTEKLTLVLTKYNKQYKNIEIKHFDKSHDRFLIIDEKEVYQIGASLKDLGKNWFAFSKLDKKSLTILEKLI